MLPTWRYAVRQKNVVSGVRMRVDVGEEYFYQLQSGGFARKANAKQWSIQITIQYV
jgi:hypothetical protein